MNIVEFGCDHPDVIVLLHGGGLSWWQYEESAALLAERFHVVLPLLDGHAGSDAPFTTMADCAQHVIDHIDAAYGGRVTLLGGTSLGGQAAAEILSRRDDICDFAVLESTLVIPMSVTAACIRPAYALCYPLIKKRWFAQLQFLSMGLPPDQFEAYFRDSACISKADMTAFLAANASFPLPAGLADCRAKTLILAGRCELPVMKRSARRLAAVIPNAQLDILPGYAHGEASIRHPQQFADSLLHLIGC